MQTVMGLTITQAKFCFQENVYIPNVLNHLWLRLCTMSSQQHTVYAN